tara:strand:- start:1321 stop:1770 length:450 start_codon:yes stop_codon:yes gene_type:complete
MNIQDLETKYKELGAEIERLKQQPEGVWEPTVGGTFWMVDWSGGVRSLNPSNRAAVNHHNVYETEEQARKASVLQRRSNLVIQACLNFDPDFVLNWNDLLQPKIGFYYCQDRGKWARQWESIHNVFGVYVSSEAIADKVLDYLNSQEIK